MPTVSGFARNETGGPAPNATVKAFDKDLRHEQLLGEAVITETTGHYEITYTADQIRRAEKKTVDLIVRLFDRADNLRAESEIRFNARDTERVDLTFGPLPATEAPRLSELEELQASIEPVREGVRYGDFTDTDLTFLTEETIRAGSLVVAERRTIREHLGFLRLADQFARRTDIPLEAFYGWFRQNQPQVLNQLLDVSISVLRAALATAVQRRIIPDITSQTSEILDRIRSVRLEEGRLVNHRFVVQLINAGTGRPLTAHIVEVTDLAAETDEQDLGTLITDGRGVCVIIFSLPGGAPANTTRRLRVRILDNSEIVAETEIEARANQEAMAEIRVSLRENESEDASIGDVASPRLAARLRQQGINTLRDMLTHPDVTDGDDAEGLERLRATAKFAVLNPELPEAARAVLLDNGYRNPRGVGATSRAEFVRVFHEHLGGDAATYTTHFAARETGKVLSHMIGSALLTNVTTPGDQPDDPDIPTGVNDVLNGLRKCGCKDCGSAVSPAAYLAHLLEWTLEHIKDRSASITFTQLGEEFHQPFGDLPASCAAVEEQVRQVRICVEVLWRFTGLLTTADLQMPTPFRNAYRFLRNRLYRTILTNLGTSFEQLRRATLHVEGDNLTAEVVASQRRAVADLLGIHETHLNQLFFDVEQPPISPSEDELRQRFGFNSTRAADPFASPGTPDLIRWQREHLESIWQEQDWSLDAYQGGGRLPFVDPALIGETYFRQPTAENPAFTLLEARRQALAAHRQTLIDQNPRRNGLAHLIENDLGQSIGQLRSLYATLQTSGQSGQIAQAHETIATLGMTPAGFTQLMSIDARFEAGQPIGATNEEIDAAWEAVFDIFSRSHRRSLFSSWVEQENNLGLVFGPRLFWFPVEQPDPVNSWQATPAERGAWEDALRRRSEPPVIDPDQIKATDLTIFRLLLMQIQSGVPLFSLLLLPPFVTMALWQQRRTWINNRLEAVRTARQGQANAMGTLQAALNASTLGIGVSIFDELANLEASGHDPGARLAQIGLTMPEFRFLAGIHQLAVGNANVASHSWEEADAILIEAEKRREFAQWRLAEQAAGITLHPHRFETPKDSEPEDSPQTRWLHDPLALGRWAARLKARADQFQALEDGLARAVDDAAETVLPLLRNILIMRSVAPGDSLNEKAEWLDRRLLVDMRMDGCQMTTRVSQALESLQRFIRGVYTQEHLDIMRHLTLDAVEDYEAEWPVLGSYPTWRAFMLAYLYPENLLHVTPPVRQSFGLAELKGSLPARITPAHVCAAAEKYSKYFQDVFNLEVRASCQVRTRVSRAEGCSPLTAVFASRVHLFALAATSGKVYTNSFSSYFDSTDTLDSWRPIPELSNVLEIIGAVPHETPAQRRLILLFAKVRQTSRTRLKLVTFDLDTNSWSGPDDLGLPPGARNDFSAVAVQKRNASAGETLGIAPTDVSSAANTVPAILAIRVPNGRVYVRDLNAWATEWAGDEWLPLFGDIKAQEYKRVCALIQRSRDEYLMIVEGDHRQLLYRIFSIEPVISRDDGRWRPIAKGKFGGAFVWPGTPDVFVFYEEGAKTRYAIIGSTAALLDGGTPVSSVDQLEKWLTLAPGISLTSFHVELFYGDITFHTGPDGGIFSIFKLYQGDLFTLLTLTSDTWAHSVPNGVLDGKKDILSRAQEVAVKRFVEAIGSLEQADFSDVALGQWKLGDWYVRQFASGKSLASAVQDSFEAQSETDAEEQAAKTTVFRFRAFEERIFRTSPVSGWSFIPSGGDEDTGPPVRKPAVVTMTNGAFRLKLQRAANDTLSAPKLSRVAAAGDGPFDLAPLSAREDLQLRRAEIKLMYQGLGSQASMQIYLKEAYNLIPTYLGYGLQRNGFYEEALLWYRQVYDYVQSPGNAKIDYNLKLEQALNWSYEDAEEWLNDASNAHAIAATRKNTYTRHILLMIIRCLIEYANALFSRDNASDNARARELYSTALRLLERNELKRASSSCANIIGQLEIDVVEPGVFPFEQFKPALEQIQDPNRLSSVVTSLRNISRDTGRPAAERLADMRATIVTAINEEPAPKRMTDVIETKRQTGAILEDRFLADQSRRILLTRTHQRSRQTALTSLAETTDRSEDVLLQAASQLQWLRQPRHEETADDSNDRVGLALFHPGASRRLAVLSEVKSALPMASLTATHNSSFGVSTGIFFDFCIPQNPVVQSLRTRALINLNKLRSCRNIAGFLRELDPYGAPIGIGSGMVSPDGRIFSGIVDAPPTSYRYAALIARAKELVGISQHIEAGYQAALENAEREHLTLMQAEQSVELAGARVTLQDLRVTQANNELGLAQLQKSSSVLREETYAGWISAGVSEYENKILKAYRDAGEAQQSAARAHAIGQVANAAMAGLQVGDSPFSWIFAGVRSALAHVMGASAIAEGVFNVQAIRAQTSSQVNSALASFERREQEWQLQQGLAALDVQMSDQRIVLAQNQIDIAQQERVIAGMEQAHAADVLNFLLGKTFTEEMYRWIASVLEDVYRFFLQEATAVARLAERQLAFERQQAPLKVIQSDYWDLPADTPAAAGLANPERLGLTGSARLLKDTYQLDSYAFETRQRMQALTLTLDLAAMFPVEFQRFRETGVLIFETPLSLIDRQMPGYYLCLIQQVSVSVVALIPPTYGIRATLTSAGTSRVVVGGDTFQTVTIRNLPERMALTSATTTSGAIALDPDGQSLLNPFEGTGFDTLWELKMSKAANPFDYNSMATVLFTVNMTALHSFDYEQEVIQHLDRRISFDRAFDFRQVFADPWYDLNNPDQTNTPMAVRFETRTEDFPSNLRNLTIQHVLLYAVRKDGEAFEQPIRHLHFTAAGMNGAVGGPATTVEGRVSTRSGNGANWLPMIGQLPHGVWELAFPDNPPANTEARNRFASESIENLLLVITVSGETEPYPS